MTDLPLKQPIATGAVEKQAISFMAGGREHHPVGPTFSSLFRSVFMEVIMFLHLQNLTSS